MAGLLSGPMEVPGYAFVSTPPPDTTVEDVAADHGLELMKCERMRGKITAYSCAKMWWVSNKNPLISYGAVVHEQCNGCEIGKDLAKKLKIKVFQKERK